VLFGNLCIRSRFGTGRACGICNFCLFSLDVGGWHCILVFKYLQQFVFKTRHDTMEASTVLTYLDIGKLLFVLQKIASTLH
jgi:hypothetical protein